MEGFYVILAAIFFALCAYAQLNDPDPILWAGLYVFSGCLLNFLVLFRIQTKLCKLLTDVILIGCLAYTAYLTYNIANLYGDNFSLEAPLQALWTYVEFEEGREAAGLLLLAAHQLVLASFLPTSSSSKVRILFLATASLW